jgi:D-3-phosphoglycerate dehydrogenase/C-terminal binding protein
MPQARVIIADFQKGAVDVEQKILGDLAEVVPLDVSSEEQLWGRVEDAAAIMVYHTLKMTPATISRLQGCKLIVRCGVGYDNVDYVFARSRGIPVANVPDYGNEEVADSALGLMLALTRGIAYQNMHLRPSGTAWRYDHVAPLYRLRGRTVGVIGLGRIGTAFALRAQTLGMDVAFYDPYKADGYDKSLGVRRVESLAELLAQSLVVSCHCPLTPETQHIMNAATIELMPRGSYLINTSRGAVVDVAAIPAAIASGRLAGAGIDVLPIEPPAEDHPLLVAWRDPSHPCYERVILNAHNAFYSEQGLMDMRVKGSEACRRALLGEPLRNVVN